MYIYIYIYFFFFLQTKSFNKWVSLIKIKIHIKNSPRGYSGAKKENPLAR